MRAARTRHSLVAAVSLAAAVALATPAAYAAPDAPTPETSQTEQELGDQTLPLPAPGEEPEVNDAELASLGAFAPALIGSLATRGEDGSVNEELLTQARSLADNAAVPAEVRDTWNQLIDFLGEPGKQEAAAVRAAEQLPGENPAAKKEGAPDIPSGPNAPRIQEFLYPTIGLGCQPGGGSSVGMALVTAGPQAAPAPGPKRGQAGFVYTSLGTGPAKRNNGNPLWVSWVNLETGKTGQVRLQPNARINAKKGPGTFTAIAKTGRGRILATVYGSVTTTTKGKTVSCGIAPTIGTAII